MGVSFRGLGSSYGAETHAGGTSGRRWGWAGVFGLGGKRGRRRRSRLSTAHPPQGDEREQRRRRIAVTAAVVIGLAAGRGWAHAGVAYASNVLNWLQNASALMLIGGFRGAVTPLTAGIRLGGGSSRAARRKSIR